MSFFYPNIFVLPSSPYFDSFLGPKNLSKTMVQGEYQDDVLKTLEGGEAWKGIEKVASGEICSDNIRIM